MTPQQINQRLEEIAREIKRGADPESFTAEIDVLTGNTMAPRNTYEDQIWEAEYRRQGEP